MQTLNHRPWAANTGGALMWSHSTRRSVNRCYGKCCTAAGTPKEKNKLN